MPDTPQISVVIPAYNEALRLPRTLKLVHAHLTAHYSAWEILVADDGSTDGTAEVVQRDFPWARVLSEPNQGKGAAVKRGMLAAQGTLRLFTDADLSTPIEELEGLRQVLEGEGLDVVIASRALKASRLEIRRPWWREMAGRTFNGLVRPLAGLPFHDTQCGFKLFTAAAADRLFPLQQSSGWAFDVELLMLARHLGLRVREVPVAWRNDAASKVSLASAAPSMLTDILRFRIRLLFNPPH